MKKLYFILISAVIFIFIVSMAFILNICYGTPSHNNLIMYIIAKCIYALAFVCVVVSGLKKRDSASYIIQYVITLGMQFVPLVIRLCSNFENGFLISIILFFITLIIYLALFFGLNLLSVRSLSAEKKLEGKSYVVKENADNER